VNTNFKIVGKSPFIQESDRNEQLVNFYQKNIILFSHDRIKGVSSSNEKINIFSHYNLIIKNNFEAVMKGKNKNCRSKNSNEVNSNPISNKNNNTEEVGAIRLNLKKFSKIKISRKLQENNIEDFNKNLNHDYDKLKDYQNKNNDNNSYNRINEYDKIKPNKTGDLNKSEDISHIKIMNDSAISSTKKINVEKFGIIENLESFKNQNEDCYTNSYENDLYNSEKRSNEQTIETKEKKSRYEFRMDIKKIKKNNEKDLKSSNEFAKRKNMKTPAGKIDENKNSISDISKTNNLIKVYCSENSNPESRNINNGLFSNLNSSKCSEFE